MGFKARQKQRYGPVIKAADMREEYFADGRVWEWRTHTSNGVVGATVQSAMFIWHHDGWVGYQPGKGSYTFASVNKSSPTEEWREVLRG